METSTITDTIEEYFLTQGSGKIYRLAVERLEKALIERALQSTNGNQLSAAKILGVNRNTLRSKIRKFNISTLVYK